MTFGSYFNQEIHFKVWDLPFPILLGATCGPILYCKDMRCPSSKAFRGLRALNNLNPKP